MISRIRLSQLCGYLFIAIHSLSKGFSLSQSDTIYYLISIFSLIVLAVKAINCEFSKKEFLCYSGSMLLAMLVFLTSGNLTILLSIMAIFACKDLHVKELLKTIFFTRSFAFLTMIIISSLGIVPGNDIFFNRGDEILFRRSFGYLHPNETALQLIIIATSGILLIEKRKNKNIALCVFFLLNHLVYMATYSRSSFLIILLFLILEGLVINFKFFASCIKKFTPMIVIVPLIITILFMTSYGDLDFLYRIDEVLTGRVQYVHMITRYTLPQPLGINYDVFDLARIYIDNGFIKLLYIDGIVFSILMIPALVTLIRKFKKYGKVDYLVVVILFLFYAITESSFDNAINTYIWLMLPTTLMSKKYREELL